MKNQSICPFAWDSAAVRPNGEVIPCCLFKNYINHNNNWGTITEDLDFRNNDLWKNLRKRMLEGERIPECRDCYAIEDQGHQSMRIANIDRLPKNLTEDCLDLTYLEMSFSNLCNLACVSCSVYCSSRWGTEDYKKNPNLKISSLVEHNVNLTNLSTVTTLKIIGGEPLMEQKRFIELLKKLNLPKLTLMMSTNGTVIPSEELKLLLDQCQQVVIDVSIDGIGSVAEWYRWPTQFQQVELVMKQFENWWGQDSRVTLNTKTLINLFNIWTLDKIVNYVAVNYPGWTMYFDWIDHPAWQRICEIPDKFKPDLIEKLEQWNVDSQRPWHPKFNNPYQTSILKLQESNSMSWSLIKEKASTLADDRGLDLLNMLPDMKQLF